MSTEIRVAREGEGREAEWENHAKAAFRKSMEEKISGRRD